MSEKPAIVFDLGNVLLSFDYGRAVRGLMRHASVSEKELHACINQSPLLLAYEAGGMSTVEFFASVKAATTFRAEFDVFRNIFGDIFTEIPEMIDLNLRLRTEGHRSFIFSNTNELAIHFIRSRFPFFANFDGYILSYEERSMKPDARIYRAVEERTGRKGEGIIYIDDREENILTGEALGWQTIQHCDPKSTILHLNRLLGH